MATQNEKLAQALEVLRQTVGSSGVIRSTQLSRTYRERLVKAGFLEEIINGWLLVTNPASPSGSSASWYGAFWEFLSKYLDHRFKGEYCLSAESSIKIHVGSTLIPIQLAVIVQSSIAQVVSLKYGTSIVVYHTKHEGAPARVKVGGIWAMELPAAICKLSPTFFKTNQYDAEIALRMVREPSSLLRPLLSGGNVIVAGRLVGAYRFLGETRIAELIKQSMEAAGNSIRVSNPFEISEPALKGSPRITSPHVARIQAMWSVMRSHVIDAFQGYPTREVAADAYLAEMEVRYTADAYNSLSIEGYRVTPELIERVRTNAWNPDASETDKEEQAVLAARGYYQAFQAVKGSIAKILAGTDSAEAIERDYQSWYREMFSPAVLAGLLQAHQLAGYRNIPVYLRGSRHVPPAPDAIADCMDAFRDLMAAETQSIVRAVLGHYIFVYIHPFSDGNGRIGRFIMNAALASGGYPWTVIRQSRRDEYLAALEQATISQNLRPFADFVHQEMEAPMKTRNEDGPA